MEKSTIRVLLADDHQVLLEGLQLILENDPHIVVVATAVDGHQVLSYLESNSVDILVLDLNMPLMDGFETMNKLRIEYPHLRTVILSFSTEGSDIQAALEAGAKGYVVKNRSGKELVEAIHAVWEGSVYFPPSVMEIYTKHLSAAPDQQMLQALDTTQELSPRQKEVLACVLDGMTSVQIGDTLCIEPSTVETHKKKIREKFSLLNNAQIGSLAVRLGIVPWSQQVRKKR